MKKTLFFIAYLIASIIAVNAQQLVFDPAVVSTLVTNHSAQQGMLTQIRNEETKIAGFQATIALKMAEIKELETKMHKALTTVDQILIVGQNGVYATQIIADIGRYQRQMIDIAVDDPELMLIAVKAELELINRTADLVAYIVTATTGGEINMMSNAERMNMIRHVIDNLRIMRGMAYGIVRRMRVAKYAGVWQTMTGQQVRYIDRRKEIANRLINEFKR